MATLRTWVTHPMEHDSEVDLRRVGIPVSAHTVADVLAAASRELSIRFEPYEGPIWFRAYGIPPNEEIGWITDVSIQRGEDLIYPLRPKRDTSFPVFDSDIISIFIITG